MSRRPLALCLAVAAALLGAGADAADPARPDRNPKKMRMNEPMSTGMMKKGMVKGDVKKAAERKADQMKPMMEQEEKAMPPPAKAGP